ncbi:MAG: hypothetical protein ACLFVD_02700 [Dehalococcoidia bacterium]
MSELRNYPHHTRKGAIDWEAMPSAIAALRGSYTRPPVPASPEQRLAVARHLARHYHNAGRPIPATLAAMT